MQQTTGVEPKIDRKRDKKRRVAGLPELSSHSLYFKRHLLKALIKGEQE